jgi:flagellar hook-associated protein 2
MNVDATQLASNFASLEVQPFEFRYNQKLSMIASKTSAIGKVKTALQTLENKIYEFTKPGSSLTPIIKWFLMPTRSIQMM